MRTISRAPKAVSCKRRLGGHLMFVAERQDVLPRTPAVDYQEQTSSTITLFVPVYPATPSARQSHRHGMYYG